MNGGNFRLAISWNKYEKLLNSDRRSEFRIIHMAPQECIRAWS